MIPAVGADFEADFRRKRAMWQRLGDFYPSRGALVDAVTSLLGHENDLAAGPIVTDFFAGGAFRQVQGGVRKGEFPRERSFAERSDEAIQAAIALEREAAEGREERARVEREAQPWWQISQRIEALVEQVGVLAERVAELEGDRAVA